MIGHNTFSWVDLRAETILGFRMEGNGDSSDYWKTYPNSSADAPSNWDEWTHEDNGWVADGCQARFYLSKGSGDSISITYPLDSAYNTGEWYMPTANGEGGATSMTISGLLDGEIYTDSYTRAMMIVGNHWDNDTDSEIERIQTIARPIIGNAKWTWISGLSDLPTNCGETTECTYSQWSEWSSCDYNDAAKGQYNDGLQTRTRSVQSGSDCVGELTQTQPCAIPTNCEWGEWSEWVYDNSPNRMHGQGNLSGCGVWDGDTESFPSSLTRTRTRQLLRGSKGYENENEGCPDRDSYVGDNGLTQYTNTQTETETVYCPSSENSNCPDGEEIRWRWGPVDATNADGSRPKGWYCHGCTTGWDETTTETDTKGCKTGCKTGYEDINLGVMGMGSVCHIVGCTDPTAKNYDDTATLACNSSSIGTKWKVGAAGLDGNANANKCCEYDCDNPLLKTDWNGQCKDECIDGYALNSAGECEEQCNEGFELIDGECQKSPDPDDKKTIITTQTDTSTVIEPESSNMTPIIGGIAVLGVVGYFLMQRK